MARKPILPRPQDPYYFPDVLKTYPPHYQVVWLYFREFPGAKGTGTILREARGGTKDYNSRVLTELTNNGLLYIFTNPARRIKTTRGRPAKCYRVCTEAEESKAKSYVKPAARQPLQIGAVVNDQGLD